MRNKKSKTKKPKKKRQICIRCHKNKIQYLWTPWGNLCKSCWTLK